MAFRRFKGRSNGNSQVIMGTLSGIVGLILGLWVFNSILTTVIPLANVTGSYFTTAINFTVQILPVVGIIAGYIMIKGAIKRMSF